MKFDLVFSNPPYNKNIDIKILNEIFDISTEFIIVHPSGWLIDLKDKSVLYRTFKKKIEGNVRNIELFNGNPIFNIRIFMPCSITHIDKKINDDIEVSYFTDKYFVNSIFEVNKFGSKWHSLVKPFYNQIQKFSEINDGNIWQRFSENKLVSFTEKDGFLLQLPMGRGDEDKVSHTVMVKDNFYAVFSNDQNEIETKNKSPKVYFSRGTYHYFKTEVERENFINYLKTDFARFCLSIYKIRKDYDAGELSLIPWLDFTEEWDDDKLFAKFDVSQELQDYIREFLPDYYGIRK
jgi:hypothetical protein